MYGIEVFWQAQARKANAQDAVGIARNSDGEEQHSQ
jgi:hypothetical protein